MPIVFAILLAGAIVPGMAAGQEQQLKKIHVNGVELHYVDRGQGEPVIFIHGGLADYRMWEAQTAAFARDYRTIAYSRRYNFPNTNRRLRPDYSWSVDAQDLAALITAPQAGARPSGRGIGWCRHGPLFGRAASGTGSLARAGRAAGASLGERRPRRSGGL